MARVTVEDSLDKIPNRFTLVVLVAKRLRQLLKGDEPLVQANNKHIVNALREVAAGQITSNISKEDMASNLEAVLKREKKEEKKEEEVSTH